VVHIAHWERRGDPVVAVAAQTMIHQVMPEELAIARQLRLAKVIPAVRAH